MSSIKSVILSTAADKVVDTPWVQRYKGTILIVVTAVAGALSAAAPYLVGGPTWLAPVVTAIVGVAAALVNRLTQDGFTPSMGQRLAAAAPEGEVTTPEPPAPTAPSLPVYRGPTVGG